VTATGRSEFGIRPMTTDDWPAIRAIYAAGIATGNATFETSVPGRDAWDESHRADLCFVGTIGDEVIGWVAAGDVSDRCCYAGVIEHSVYVAPAHQGRGVGRRLLDHLVGAAPSAGVWTIQTGIFPENRASLELHTAAGFRLVGRRERLGQLRGVWRDVLMLELRLPD